MGVGRKGEINNPKEVAMAISSLLFLMSVVRMTSATIFTYNGFNASDGLIFLQGASLDEDKLSLMEKGVVFSNGRVLYPIPIRFGSFSTSFIFSIVTGVEGQAQGMAFLVAPNTDPVLNSSGGYLGLFNRSTNGNPSARTLGVELDTYSNPESLDADDNQVGVDINNIISVVSASPVFLTSPAFLTSADGYNVDLKSGEAIQIWIDYDANRTELNFSISGSPGVKPPFPFFSNSSLNLSVAFGPQDNVYVGFSAATAYLTNTSCFIHSWSFSNEGPSPNITLSSPASQVRKRNISLILGSVLGSLAIACCTLLGILLVNHRRKKRMQKEVMPSLLDGMDLSRTPQRFTYKELRRATQGFSKENLLGKGGFGSVYRGMLPDGTVIAVKQVSKGSQQGMKEFVAEISIIGRLRHRHLVPLLGWCPDRGLTIVYEYMPNGNLDSYLFKHKKKTVITEQEAVDPAPILNWVTRCKILEGVASALVYLHEEWEQKVIHRDVKASNVLLDGEFNARLGDFGLVRLYNHDATTMAFTSDVAGTFGYLAPEYVLTRKFTDKVDVYSFGALVVEVMTGKRILSEVVEMTLVDWLWQLQSNSNLSEAIDRNLFASSLESDCDAGVEMLQLGLLCLHPNPTSRPSMKRVLQAIKAEAPLPAMSLIRPPLVISDLISPSQTFGEIGFSAPSLSEAQDSEYKEFLR